MEICKYEQDQKLVDQKLASLFFLSKSFTSTPGTSEVKIKEVKTFLWSTSLPLGLTDQFGLFQSL